MKVSTVEQMRELDRTAVERYGIAEALLMENAGSAAYTLARDGFGVKDRKWLVFCGGGNNGGDGFVVARKILADGGVVKVFLLGDPETYHGAARDNLAILEKLPIEVRRLDAPGSVRSLLYHCDGVVDAIFGTGLSREVGGRYREMIELINESRKPVLSLDIPSGVAGDTGRILGCAVRADATVTFGLPKAGNLIHPGGALGGELFVTHISFPPELHEAAHLDMALFEPLPLPPRDPGGHKGSFGDALFIAGAAAYYGAPCFAARAFLRAGGGYARLAAPRSVIPFLAAGHRELVFAPQDETPSGSLARSAKDALLDLAAATDFTVLGPGLSLDPETRALVRDLAAGIPGPLLVDGDGITALCEDLKILRQREAPTILTPHPGEMGRILGLSAEDVEADRVAAVRQAALDLDATVVLKGAHSITASPSGRLVFNLTGNSGMATAGSGDVLAGAIAAMACLGLEPEAAAGQGVFLHGLAGDLAAETLGEDGLTAPDILEGLPRALRMTREGFTGEDALRLKRPGLL